ncbi:MAG TPA: patatin-like phospholipase family protein, partial [Anaerolineaceae bacterium]|nr:patatin-like phospholipase family protein [Anaerolineaceae bacterium]
MSIIRTLVLSGGGGRGAFHAGVYKYLCETSKPGVDDEHQGSWTPDIIVGTSIGAVNGAAITQGYSGEDLVELWRGLREQDIQGLPPTMSWLSRRVANRILRGMIGVPLPRVPKDISTSPPPEISPALLPGMGRFSRWLLGRWGSLLDTGPLRRTLVERMKINEQSLAQSQRTLLINATNVSTGQRAVFSNRPIYKRGTTQPRSDVTPGITIQRILASCSIPLVYPWTVDDETHAIYWDGALVSNTPMGAALDAAANCPDDDVMEVVVVMMTPWRTQEDLGTA